MNFDQTNPAYTEHAPLYERSARLYDGGAKVEGGNYLVRHAWEPEKQFEIRKQRAVYANYASPVVDVFSDSVTEKRPAAKLPERLEAMAVDVDRQGKDREVFFQGIVTQAAAIGACFVLVDHPGVDGGTSAMPYFVPVNALNVIDWRIGDDGVLDWCVIREIVERPRQPFEAPQTVTRYTLWTRTTWERYEEDVLVGSGEHGLGVVPVVCFAFEQTGPMTGLGVVDEVASLILRIFRRGSELDKMMFDCAVPLLHMAGVTREQADEFVKASWNAVTTEQDARILYVEPSGGSFSALMQSLDQDVSRVREIALRMVRPQSGSIESADSKRLDFRQLESQLARFARACQEAEEQCWAVAAKWLKMGDVEVSTPYTEDYDVGDAGAQITNALLNLRKNGDISRNVLLSSPEVAKILPEDFDSAENDAELKNEAQQNEGPTGAGATGLAALGRQLAAQSQSQGADQ